MKKIFSLTIIALFALIVMATGVQAEGNVVEMNGQEYATLAEAIANVPENGEATLTLIANVENAAGLSVDLGKNITIDLNGKTINGGASTTPVFTVSNGSVKLTGTGTINATGDAFDLLGNYNGSDWETVAIKAELEVGANVTIVSEGECCIYYKGNGAKVDIYGSLTSKGTYATIQGNGNPSSGKTLLNIYDGASVIGINDQAIFHPQNGTVNVYGGTISGTTGIEMRAGKLLVEGGNITGTASTKSVVPNGNGSTSAGIGIAVVQHSTNLDTNVVVTGGTIKGVSAVHQENVENNADEAVDKVSIELNGGKFEAINGGTEAVYSENKTDFISGGTFNTDVDEYVEDIVTSVPGDNGEVLVGTLNAIEVKPAENGTVGVTLEEAVKGQKVKITATPAEGYKLSGVIKVYDANNNPIQVVDGEFVMPDGKVFVEVAFEEEQEQNPGQTPDDGEQNPGQTPDDGEQNPGQTPDDGEQNPGQTPDDEEQNPGQTPDDEEQNPGQTPDDGEETPGQTPDNEEEKPVQTPDDGEEEKEDVKDTTPETGLTNLASYAVIAAVAIVAIIAIKKQKIARHSK